MKIQVRHGVFETNSSSTHSICIAREVVQFDKSKTVRFGIGEFGWEFYTLRSTEDKASYLYTGILSLEYDDYLDELKDLLDANGIKYEFEEPKYREISHGKYLCHGYIDHGYGLSGFIRAVLKDSNKLISYLFSDKSFILTGNDNSNCNVDGDCLMDDVECDECPHSKMYIGKLEYEYDEYYKGN